MPGRSQSSRHHLVFNWIVSLWGNQPEFHMLHIVTNLIEQRLSEKPKWDSMTNMSFFFHCKLWGYHIYVHACFPRSLTYSCARVSNALQILHQSRQRNFRGGAKLHGPIAGIELDVACGTAPRNLNDMAGLPNFEHVYLAILFPIYQFHPKPQQTSQACPRV